MSDQVVSSDDERLILVDGDDQPTGSLPKGACHDGEGILHRAFSVFLFDDQNRLLLQRRAANKRLWPHYWANSCCSHPRLGEGLEEATERRLQEELGVSAPLEYIFKFEYHARYEDLGSEHELCSVYLGRVDASLVDVNVTEIDAIDWKSIEAVDELMSPEGSMPVAPWFRLEWAQLRGQHDERFKAFLKTMP